MRARQLLSRPAIFLAFSWGLAATASAATVPPTLLACQFGTSNEDWAHAVSADGQGGVYVAGHTMGSLAGPNAGSADAFLSKYSLGGSLLWSRQLGSADYEAANSVSADRLGHVYVAGTTSGGLGGVSAGGTDAYVANYDPAGNLLWIRQQGTTANDYSSVISADCLGNVYLGGYTSGRLGGPSAGGTDVFVSKYDAAGNPLWSRQIGSASDEYGGLAADGQGNVYVAGHTYGSLFGPSTGREDVFLAKYDAAGNLLWGRQFGTAASDQGGQLAADGLGNVYLGGTTWGSLGGPLAGSYDCFLRKYDADGDLLWTRQFGTAAVDELHGLSADGLDSVYVAGATWGSLGAYNAGSADAFLAKYDAAGNLTAIRQFGTPGDDWGNGVCADRLGNVCLTGVTRGGLFGPAAGGYDAYFVKTVPESSSLALFGAEVLGVTALAAFRLRSRHRPVAEAPQ